jgi:hypothetical protein
MGFFAKSGVKSIQRGTASMNGAATVNVTITAVDMNKTQVVNNGTNTDVTTFTDFGVRALLTTTTNIAFVRIGSTNGTNTSWEAISNW